MGLEYHKASLIIFEKKKNISVRMLEMTSKDSHPKDVSSLSTSPHSSIGSQVWARSVFLSLERFGVFHVTLPKTTHYT